MYTFLVILAVITAVLLAIVVLIQESKGGGLASNVSSANSVLGVRQTTNFIEKATWTLAGLLVVFSVATSFFAKSPAENQTDVITNMPTTTVPTNSQQTPTQQQAPATQGQQAPAAGK